MNYISIDHIQLILEIKSCISILFNALTLRSEEMILFTVVIIFSVQDCKICVSLASKVTTHPFLYYFSTTQKCVQSKDC